ncbi:MAG TPA: four helix bundle protein [Gammaproteobacteria bacterium]|nr:four helix bundle protein [Gammaproteobacteria bacterium]
MDALNELHVWQRSKDLAVSIYKLLFSCKDRGFKDQLTRACISIPSNIAEGYERHSKKEFARYLKIAKGSCAEVRTQLIIGQEIGLRTPKYVINLLKSHYRFQKCCRV